MKTDFYIVGKLEFDDWINKKKFFWIKLYKEYTSAKNFRISVDNWSKENKIDDVIKSVVTTDRSILESLDIEENFTFYCENKHFNIRKAYCIYSITSPNGHYEKNLIYLIKGKDYEPIY